MVNRKLVSSPMLSATIPIDLHRERKTCSTAQRYCLQPESASELRFPKSKLSYSDTCQRLLSRRIIAVVRASLDYASIVVIGC